MSTSTREITTWRTVATGDIVHFADTPYVVQAIGSVIDGGRSVVLADTNDGNPYFYEADQEVEVVRAATPARPTIDFSLSRYATARDCARDLVSRTHKDETNQVLEQIQIGDQVDAYAILGALPDVFSVCATRAGQSTGRREYTKRARHLAHIAQAVVENHADGLPAYAEGDRSRAVEDAKTGLEAARLEIERLTASLNEAHEQRARMAQEAIGLREEIAALLEERDESADEVSKLSRTLGYTRGLGTAEQAAQSLGYQHGLEGR